MEHGYGGLGSDTEGDAKPGERRRDRTQGWVGTAGMQVHRYRGVLRQHYRGVYVAQVYEGMESKAERRAPADIRAVGLESAHHRELVRGGVMTDWLMSDGLLVAAGVLVGVGIGFVMLGLCMQGVFGG